MPGEGETCGKQDEVTYCLNGKVLSVSFIGVCVTILIMMLVLTIALYKATNDYLDKMREVAKQEQMISTLQRALDRLEGKASVYERVFRSKEEEVTARMIMRFIQAEQKTAADLSLGDFEKWVLTTRGLDQKMEILTNGGKGGK